ncbi:OLC1v1025247C1 [Oldenlandia corymbosa var. corymbosa]|uniref:OLC1v1025247C1 n=1 Tax=Oldenlandia corymbosa var. corymbosa TaxID=529605 RepID=A0AAV1C4T8_OLDCO|nr:OLC1v1025247C1 [Oldenlandia corymbosa var. corymbosa]
MAAVPNFFFAIIVSFLCFSPSHAAELKNHIPTVILGLSHAKAILPTPKSTSYSKTKPSEMQDMMEPLREIRDGYLISLNIGTPTQVIQVYMDTGSDLTWVPCGNLSFTCIECDDYKNSNTMAASFSPSSSSSSLRDSCSSPSCIDIHSSDNYYDPCIIAGCSLSTLLKSTCSRPCPSFAYTYGEGIVTGILTQDTLRVHGSSSNPSGGTNVFREIPRFRFGCVGTTYREPLGIAGFGKGHLSLPSQLGFLQKGFSHCFLPFKFANNPNISSPLVLGDQAISSKDQMQFTPMLKCPMFPNFYYIGLEAITLTNINTSSPEVPVSLREFDSNGNGGMLIDSGTTYTHLPEPLYTNLLNALESMITYPRAKEVETRSGFDLCYRIPCLNNNALEDNDGLPSITFHFLNNLSLPLPQGNSFYPMNAPANASVVKCLLFQSMDDYEGGPAGVFGSFQQQNMEVVYDLEKERIGFQPTDCTLAAASHGLAKV